MKIVGIIPVRLESSRLPEKALADIEGLPMIVHTFKRTEISDALDEVYVATDSVVIKDIIEKHGGKVIMTGTHHKTGSDRIAEAAQQIDADIIVNVQGDEPLLDPEHVSQAVEPLIKDPSIQIAVLVTPYKKKNSSSDIKAVLDLQNNILYCSRTDLPSNARTKVDVLWKMSFVVPFRKEFLLKYNSWEQTPLEKIEFNEYLRILEHGYKIRAVPVDHAHISVDTPEDLVEVKELMKSDIIKRKYNNSGVRV
ncbi:MAG: 3-deoxy-manno-octulosonate cytidylyltransferase [Candidatus Omnitrophica bacterium]|nr:3-deoxy-manno-octulosonate cytidylyltransferase [Candidatus Omnitrophota bacterium]